MKANWHPAILRRIHARGPDARMRLAGRARARIRRGSRTRPRARVVHAQLRAAQRNTSTASRRACASPWTIFIRSRRGPSCSAAARSSCASIPGIGRGHHHHVRTAGRALEIRRACRAKRTSLRRWPGAHHVRIVGLHAHTGSGILDVANWTETGALLAELATRFPDVGVVDSGGGIGVPEHAGQGGIDLAALDAGVAALDGRFPRIEFWMEPGRYLVAKAGVLVAHGDPVEEQGRGALRRHLDRDEFPDPPGSLWSASRDPQFDAARASR